MGVTLKKEESSITRKFQSHSNSIGERPPMAEPKPTTFQVDDEQNSTPNTSDETPGDDLYAFDFDPLSPPNISFFLPRSHNHNSYSDSDSCSASDVTFTGEEEEENDEGEETQINFVTDLFASRDEVFVVDDPDFDSYPFLDSVTHDVTFLGFAGEDADASGSSYDDELGFEFHCGSLVSEFDESPASGGPNSSTDGLRIVGFDSDSDSEEVVQVVNSASIWVDDDSNSQIGESGELEWEDVEERVEEREGLRSVIERIEELSVSSEVSSNGVATDIGEEIVRNLEWEFLLAVNNLNRGLEFDDDDDGGGDGVSYLAVRDDYMYTIEYDAIFGQFVQNESALKGSPPAAKSIVENLPAVVLAKEEVGEANLVCAVCKDELLVEEKVTKLPCCHHYHGDCIVPWLGIRNTCPVCRYELPTDDLDYEQRKNGRDVDGPPSDLQVSYNFELLP